LFGIDGAVPPVVRRYVEQGELPNIRRLVESGVWFDQCLPAFPTITPTCWSTIATGAPPLVHGVTCMDLILPGARLDQPISGYRSEMTQAERIWETAAAAGKQSLVIQYPTSGPARDPRVLQVNGTGCSALEYSPPGMQTVGSGIYLGMPGQLINAELDPETRSVAIDPFRIELIDGKIRVSDETGVLAELASGEWSPVLTRTIEHGTARFRAKALAIEPETIRLYITPIAAVAPVCSPDDFAERMSAIPLVPTFDHHHGPFGKGEIDDDTFLEIEAQNFEWLRAAVRETWSRTDCALTVLYVVLIDTINHKYRNILEGYTPASDEVKARAAKTELAAYRLVDRFLGDLLELIDDETIVTIVSDHGSVGYPRSFDPRKALKKAGLLVTDDATGEIDLQKSRAVPFSTVHIFVNSVERGGIVPQDEHEWTVQEIIAALYDYEDEETGVKQAAVALTREDARLVGLGGERTGDVVYGVTTGVGGYIGGVHACQIPTARSAGGDIRSLLIMSGPGFKQGETLSRTARAIDIAPTLCAALGLPFPAQSEGAVLHQAFSERS
jgi:arylsulfatase A-like enzyme